MGETDQRPFPRPWAVQVSQQKKVDGSSTVVSAIGLLFRVCLLYNNTMCTVQKVSRGRKNTPRQSRYAAMQVYSRDRHWLLLSQGRRCRAKYSLIYLWHENICQLLQSSVAQRTSCKTVFFQVCSVWSTVICRFAFRQIHWLSSGSAWNRLHRHPSSRRRVSRKTSFLFLCKVAYM